MEDRIAKIAERCGLGKLKAAPTAISGGFMHKMYRIDTERGVYALKLLNPGIMARADAAKNFDTAEEYERVLQKAGLPIVPAIEFNGVKRQKDEEGEYYVFDWCSGEKTDWEHITDGQCACIGTILGRIHLALPAVKGDRPSAMNYDWQKYKSIPEMREFVDLLSRAQEEYNRAVSFLPEIQCLSNGDMDPKNVLWEKEQARIIDLECLNHGNPVFDAFQLALQWSGTVTCRFDMSRFDAFMSAYETQTGFALPDRAKLYGIGFNWLEWLDYNIKRALGEECADEAEQKLGIGQVKDTLRIIRYYDTIRDEFTNP